MALKIISKWYFVILYIFLLISKSHTKSQTNNIFIQITGVQIKVLMLPCARELPLLTSVSHCFTV